MPETHPQGWAPQRVHWPGMEVVSSCPEVMLRGLQNVQRWFEGISVKRGLGGRGRHACALGYLFQGLYPTLYHNSNPPSKHSAETSR